MRRLLLAFALSTALCPSFALAEDYKIGAIKIEQPWARATPNGAKVAAGYMKLRNTGGEADRLIGGSLANAAVVQIHEMSMAGNVMKMRELPKGLEIKPGSAVELKPGSFHVMFMELKAPLKEGDHVKGTLVFEKAGTVTVDYDVRAVGSDGGHDHMKM